MSEKHLYIDLSNICYRNVHVLAPEIKSVGFGMLRHAIVKSVILIIEKFEPDKVFICCDASRNWRKKYYEPYKAHRAAAKQKQDIDWKEFSETIEEVIVGFRSYFPFYVYQMDWLEADDIISYLVRKHPNEEKLIISSDSDFIQLLKYPNTKMFCPLKKEYIKNDNPVFFLERKIVMGDKNSDNIPSIRVGIGPKKAKKLIEFGELEKMLAETTPEGKPTELVNNYYRNRKLIDLTKTPPDLLTRLEKLALEIHPASSKGVYEYIVKHKMRDMFYKITQIDRTLRKLNKYTNTSEDPSQLKQESPNF